MAKNKKNNRQVVEQPVKDHAPAAEQPMAEKCDFDAWYAMRESKIPRQHHKEIIKADFKARGLQQCESIEDFDAALKKYGVKI